MNTTKIILHKGDLPDTIKFSGSIAVDTEAMGLLPQRDRLCVVQISDDSGTCHLVQLLPHHKFEVPNLKKFLSDQNLLKIFHYGRFDIATIYHHLGVLCTPVYCTKIASKLARNYVSRHGLKNLISELLGIEISKQQRSSDWGQRDLSIEQQNYAATDVLYLHRLKEHLDELLIREGRTAIAQSCFDFLPNVAKLDLLGYEDLNLFRHD